MRKKLNAIYNGDNIFPGFSIDCVILAFFKGKIRVLLRTMEVDNYWALLGGFMFNEENSDQAAKRILETYTGVNDIFLKQFHLFTDPERGIMAKNFIEAENSQDWLLKRFISMGYFALVKYDEVSIPTPMRAHLKWFDIKNLPPLYADHNFIIKTAMETIRTMLPVIPIGYEMLPEKFTMTELRNLYEIILDTTFDRRNFQRKVLSEGNIIQLNEKKGNAQYNSASLFTLKQEKLDSLKNNNTGLIL